MNQIAQGYAVRDDVVHIDQDDLCPGYASNHSNPQQRRLGKTERTNKSPYQTFDLILISLIEYLQLQLHVRMNLLNDFTIFPNK
ncbi:hypothetical protein D3C78_520410 [compost metagenome]